MESGGGRNYSLTRYLDLDGQGAAEERSRHELEGPGAAASAIHLSPEPNLEGWV